MPDLKRFPVFSDSGRIGTLAAAARFLDSRSEKTIQLDAGGEISVPANALTVQSDGSFFLRDTRPPAAAPQPEPAPAANGAHPLNGAPGILFREGYLIEHVPIDRFVTEAPAQRQEGDTLVLPVVEEVLVTEKRLMLREEIRITRRREPLDQAGATESVQ